MTDVGKLVRADLGEERLHRVLVLSNHRFTARTGRALVAPEWLTPAVDLLPWEVRAGDGVYSVDRLVSVEARRLLDEVGEAPYHSVAAARRALLAIT